MCQMPESPPAAFVADTESCSKVRRLFNPLSDR